MYLNDENTRLYTFAVLFDRQVTPKQNLVYMKPRDKLATSDVKLSSRIYLAIYIPGSAKADYYITDYYIIISHPICPMTKDLPGSIHEDTVMDDHWQGKKANAYKYPLTFLK